MIDDNVMSAVYRQDVKALDALLAEGLNINDLDGDNRSILLNALTASKVDPSFIESLIARGADVNYQEPVEGWTGLHVVARDHNVPLGNLLLRSGATIEVEDVFGNTPLWRAAMSNRASLEMIKLLLAHGADPDHKNKTGVSPRDLATGFKQADVLKLYGSRN